MREALVIAIMILAISGIEAGIVASFRMNQAIGATTPQDSRKRMIVATWYQIFKIVVYLLAATVLVCVVYHNWHIGS